MHAIKGIQHLYIVVQVYIAVTWTSVSPVLINKRYSWDEWLLKKNYILSQKTIEYLLENRQPYLNHVSTPLFWVISLTLVGVDTNQE